MKCNIKPPVSLKIDKKFIKPEIEKLKINKELSHINVHFIKLMD